MLKYPCLVLDHDDTVVQSECTVNYPFFRRFMDTIRPGTTVTLKQYLQGCFHPGFAEMCRLDYHFTQEELEQEHRLWNEYVRCHTPAPYPGMKEIIARQKAEGGKICVVSHSCKENIIRDYQTHFGIMPDAIYGSDLPEQMKKPYTYPLTHIMQTYSFTSEQLLVVDDLKPAWKMAKDAGVAIGFAAWSKTDLPEIVDEMKSLCDYTFFSPAELEEFLFR